MAADATWFGPPDRPLAGWLHVPDDGVVRGGVVVCPPIGLEYVPSHRALRTLSERLCTRGFAVLHFDWDGTGDSSGSLEDPGRLAALMGSLGAAVQELTALVGTGALAVVGLRFGATLAATWLADCGEPSPVAAVVLWDPCLRGRRFLRQQAALGRLVGCDDAGDGSVDAPGFRYPPEAAEELGALDLTKPGRLPVSNLLILRRPTDSDVPLFPDQADAQRETVDGMPELLDVLSPRAAVPHGAIDRCVAWLDHVLPAGREAVSPRWRAEAVVADGVCERHVRLGPLGLTGVETRPPSGVPVCREVLLLSTAAESHMGPVRLWTELARDWAVLGIASTRFDLSGIGDSPTREGCADDIAYAPYAQEDLRSVLAARSDSGPPPILVGLCSGGHLAIQVGGSQHDGAVIAINVTTAGPVKPGRAGPDVDVQLVMPWTRRLLRLVGAPDFGRPLIRRIEAWGAAAPSLLWRTLLLLRLVVSPASGLATVHGADVSLICGMDDAVGYLTRGRRDLARARQRGLEFVVVDDLDHMPMPVRQRRNLKAVVTEQVLRRAAGASQRQGLPDAQHVGAARDLPGDARAVPDVVRTASAGDTH
jgi:alpha-beta hydrolase superfamily lysophospholipase